ncbi:hypothetical protein B0H14DRAFT_2619936 [Mycena olivaceomarginata]|nr:hypothetical protein B0H14DRAFT_2619936 [Mycena olivaceomarginata]
MQLELSEVYDLWDDILPQHLWSIKDSPKEMAGTGQFFVTFYPISFIRWDVLVDVGLIPHEFIAQILRNIFTGHANYSYPPFQLEQVLARGDDWQLGGERYDRLVHEYFTLWYHKLLHAI